MIIRIDHLNLPRSIPSLLNHLCSELLTHFNLSHRLRPSLFPSTTPRATPLHSFLHFSSPYQHHPLSPARKRPLSTIRVITNFSRHNVRPLRHALRATNHPTSLLAHSLPSSQSCLSTMARHSGEPGCRGCATPDIVAEIMDQ